MQGKTLKICTWLVNLMNNEREILVLVEDEKLDFELVKHLIKVYGLQDKYEIVSYKTNIYVLYQSMLNDGAFDDEFVNFDIFTHLSNREKDPVIKHTIFPENKRYSDILLMFDFEPQDPRFTPEKIQKMVNHFTESTETGKLYINYPMVEAFYHMKSIPDSEYNSRDATLTELPRKGYKNRVRKESLNGRDFEDFAISRDECSIVINQNIEKAWQLTGEKGYSPILPETIHILDKQLQKLKAEHTISVLCTSAFYIVDYNPKLIQKP